VDQTFSLYLDLESGQIADLETVARVSLALSQAVKDIAKTIDPFAEIRVELESGTEGSLRLNTVFRLLKAAIPNRTTAKAVAILLLSWFSTDIRQYGVGQIMDHFYKDETGISDQQKNEIEKIVTDLLNKKTAEEHSEQIYKELDRDTAIKGVGASTSKTERPSAIVPRSAFSSRIPHQVVVEETTKTRTITAKQTLILINPVLVHSDRGWKFYYSGIEFTAKIADKKFLENAWSGKSRIPFKEGVHLSVELKTEEKKEGGVWIVKKRIVTRVLGVSTPPQQQSLNLPHSPDE